MPEKVTVGEQIGAAYRAVGLNQRGLTAKAGVPRRATAGVLAGKQEASAAQLLAIAQATGTTISALTSAGVARRRRWATHAGMAMSAAEGTRADLTELLELNAYLDSQAIPHSVIGGRCPTSRAPRTGVPEAGAITVSEHTGESDWDRP